ncbi:phage tail domain-containing protein [uncultured Kocuria sp.]|uniref:phage tail domain-containing protein n=1 Tax=uncultured Kocuria sp. TaxID=259305 RepID=UPI0026099868|nr:phage tail domain-containing protein [uncultured Kocuria sp.]
MIGLKYGAFDLQANGFRVTDTDIYSAPTNRIQADPLAERDGALIVKQQYDSKTFTVEGWFRKSTIAEVEQARDEFMRAMGAKNQALDIDYAGGVRRYLASAQNVILSRIGLTSFGFSIEFLSPDGMGWDLSSTTLVAGELITNSSATIPIDVGGSYKAEPVISVLINDVTGGVGKTVTISNGISLRQIQVTRDWVAGDLLEISTIEGTVFVNNIATDFTGQLPEFEAGIGRLGYNDDFTTRNALLTAGYVRRWL